MKIFLNIIGLFLTIGSALVVGETLLSWRGVLRSSVFMIFLSFVFFGAGFIWNIFASDQAIDFGISFFSLGAALLLLGAKRLFAFSSPSGV